MVIQEQYFPDCTCADVRENKVRNYIRDLPEYDEKNGKTSVQYNQDGSVVSTKFLTLQQGDNLTPDELLRIHGFDVDKWQVIDCINNFWNSQLTGGILQVSYQSKLRAKPKKEQITFKDVDRYLESKQFQYDKPLTEPLQYDPSGEVLEIDLPDLHSGLLSWRIETGADYDIHIAKDHFFKCVHDVIDRCEGHKFKKIIFVTLGDLLHFDNDKQETTKGTFQQADGRVSKIFDATLDMLIDGITLLGGIAPVEVVYIAGNHDRVLGYTLMKSVEMAFRKDSNITFDTTPDPQKHRLIGVNLIGWTHGDMPKKNMGGWLQQTARQEYGLSKFAEVHAGHFHSQSVKELKQTEEDAGVVVRYLPTICNASYWEHQQGYSQGAKAVMSFVWNEQAGLRSMWYSNI